MSGLARVLAGAALLGAGLSSSDAQTEDPRGFTQLVTSYTVDKTVFGGAKFYYSIANLNTGATVASGTMDDGGLERLILTPQTPYRMVAFYSETLAIGGVTFTTPGNGRSFSIPEITFEFVPDLADSDVDGLPDIHENLVGTSNLNPDTDGDGFEDGAEVIQGKEPLDGYVTTTGVIASAPADSTARDICAINNVAIMAVGTGGVVVYNVRDGDAPVRIAQVDTPGSADAVTCFSNLIAVADGPEGLAIVDITDPPAAEITYQRKFNANATAVAARGNQAFVGLANGEIVMVDMFSGFEIGRYRSLPAGVGDLVARGNFLYALVSGALHTFTVNDGDLQLVNSDSSPGNTAGMRPRLFLGDGFGYASNQRGYNVFSFADPADPGLVISHTTPQFGWKQVVATGSGAAIACVGANAGAAGAHNVNLLSVGLDGQSFATDFTYETLGRASAVALYNGYAYIADGTFGLQVINYQGLDQGGVEPALTLEHGVVGGMFEEGKIFSVFARATDDVQVRNVDFFINGEVIATDGNYPFALGLIAPAIIGDADTFTFKAIAYDTGGNATESDDIDVMLIPDATPPTIRETFPAANALVGALDTFFVSVSENIDPATINATSMQWLYAGPDNVLGTLDDAFVSGVTYNYDPDSFTLALRAPESLPVGLYRLTITDPFADPAGNGLVQPYRTGFRVLGFPDEDSDGVPDDQEAALGFDPLEADSDGDGTPDGAEDNDADGLSNAGEFVLGTDPLDNDSDDDGTLDGAEDTDLDTITDGAEIAGGTDPTNADTDLDGIDDGSEGLLGTDPLDPDSEIPLQVSSRAVSYFNGVLDPDGVLSNPVALSLQSRPVSYYNGVVADISGDPYPVSIASDSVSYFNGVVSGVGPVAVWLASDPVSYEAETPPDP